MKTLIPNTSIRESWTLICSLFIVGVSWGTLSARMENLESRMDTYETQTVLLLEQLRSDLAAVKIEQTRMANDLSWIKKEFSPPTK